ncbi:Disease resistance protein (CC-NBS-LRR class) family [Rhynchospora pubera]|uniref:Disease resistance protein (CC-NBS-LRR class) family n=1 Tax=Rhynchospora pubera TaxID=906938 RepID=A0AAV8CYT0_9POAL|nr:Disease resistance protein (CC-NBS-LRR class) family [Rhynchospora pubera]
MNLYEQVFSPVFLIEQELRSAAKSISSKCCMELRRSMDMLWSCMLYTVLVGPNYYSPERANIETKELIQMWIAEGLLTRDIKLRHVESEFLAEELNVLTSFDEEAGIKESEKEEDSLINDQYFGMAEKILQGINSWSPFTNETWKRSDFTNGMWILLNKWKSLYKRNNVNLNHWSSERWESAERVEQNIIFEANRWVNKSWIIIDVYSHWEDVYLISWIVHPKLKNTTAFVSGFPWSYVSWLDGLLGKMPHLRVLKLIRCWIQYLPHESLSGLANLRLLSLLDCDLLRSLGTASSSLSSCISSLEKLEFLDLVNVTSLEVIPDDLGNKKKHLYFLRISDHKITSLPLNLFNDMPNLRELVFDSNKSKSLTGLSPLASLTNLETLSLSNTKIVSLPPDTFEKMQCIRVLKLIDNPLMETLPKSLCGATMLEKLELRDCDGLKSIDVLPTRNLKSFILDGRNDWIQSLPESLSRSHNLQEVQISGCSSLKEIKMIGNVSVRSFSLSNSSITSLSLCGCQELALIDLKQLKELEDLNLSGTSITEIPDISDFPRLKKFDLLAVPHLRRAPWHKLDRIPGELNLDQCDSTNTIISGLDAHGNINYGKLSKNFVVGFYICVWDSRLFMNLNPKHCINLLEKGSLQSVYILVASCEKRKEELTTSPSQTIPIEWSCYKDVRLNFLASKPLLVQQPQQPQCRRHIEISSTECYPCGLEGILEITELFSVKNNIHISSISDLNPRLPMLLALQIEECHKIEYLFDAMHGENVCPQLQDFSVARLHSMSHLLIEKGTHFLEPSFVSLKNLHLSECERLEVIFPDNVVLPNLEKLIISGCPSLRTVFYKSGYYTFDTDMVNKFRENHLRSLHTMQLHLLPQLLYIFEKQRFGAFLIQKWKTLFFRGCWGLRQLPHLLGPRDQKVRVDGETKICNTIKKQMDTEQLSYYEFRPKPLISSTRDDVKNNIFLK